MYTEAHYTVLHFEGLSVRWKLLKAPPSGLTDTYMEIVHKTSVRVCALNDFYVSLKAVWRFVSAMVVTLCMSDRAVQ